MDELLEYIFIRRSASYYLAHINRIVSFAIFRPLCVFGYHHHVDGIGHMRMIDGYAEKYETDYKCYHCRYCDKPMNQELHDMRLKD